MYQSELTSTWDPSEIPPFSQLKPDTWNLFLRWQFAVLLFSTVFKFVYATASHMLWFLRLLYVMTRLLRGHEELIVTTQNCAHRNVQLILFQTADVSGPQLRKDPPWFNFGRHYYVLAFWVVTHRAFNCILVSKKPQFLTPPKKVWKNVTLSSVVQCWPNILHTAVLGKVSQRVVSRSAGQCWPSMLQLTMLANVCPKRCIQQCCTKLVQHVTFSSVGQRWPNLLHRAVLGNDCPTRCIQNGWTVIAQQVSSSSVGQCWPSILHWTVLDNVGLTCCADWV